MPSLVAPGHLGWPWEGGSGKVKICPRNRVKDPENGLVSIRGSWGGAIWGPAVLDPFRGLWRAPKSNLGHFRGNFFICPNIVSIKIMKRKEKDKKTWHTF